MFQSLEGGSHLLLHHSLTKDLDHSLVPINLAVRDEMSLVMYKDLCSSSREEFPETAVKGGKQLFMMAIARVTNFFKYNFLVLRSNHHCSLLGMCRLNKSVF